MLRSFSALLCRASVLLTSCFVALSRSTVVRDVVIVVVAFLCATIGFTAPAPLGDDAGPRLPMPGDVTVHLLTPALVEVTLVTSAATGSKPVNLETAARSPAFKVTRDDAELAYTVVGAKRRALYAPLRRRDLRVATSLFLRLQEPLPLEAAPTLTVAIPAGELSPTNATATVTADPLRYSPALHVNQEGYAPGFPKIAEVGYYLGTAGELEVPATDGFDVLDATTGKSVFHGTLRLSRDSGFTTLPKPYQSVYEADFTAFNEPGEYRLAVAGLGASLPFRIDEGLFMNFARAYAAGLYHQRCGTTNVLPFTRFTHDACHTKPAEVPLPESDFEKAWKIIADLEKDNVKAEHPEKQLKRAREQLFPYVKVGRLDVSGGHHDAGDYSKYTTNSASLVHALIFAVDSFPGVAELDNLGLPESGDGVGDVLQEAKWESDFLSKIQDTDGGFYFLVYPRDRRYENDVPPDRGDPQIVWPKTTASTAAAVAALAQCAGSPAFRKQYPDDAKRYLEQAIRGWKFLQTAISRHGAKSYQRLTHYGDAFDDQDELAWAACELFVATGDRAYEKKLLEVFPNPGDPKTWQYQWRRASFAYGNALRSYAFAVRNGRRQRNEVDAGYLARCETELRRAGEAAVKASEISAYGVSLPEPSKRIGKSGWFFPNDDGFDITVAWQLQQWPKYQAAVVANLNYEAGSNPVNRTFLTGVGQRRQREIVHQYAQTDARVLPPTGIPIGSIASDFAYLDQYRTELKNQSWPHDDDGTPNYPLYDRWTDTYNFNTEFVVVNQGRALASLAYWAAQSPLKQQAWRTAKATIRGAAGKVGLGQPVTFELECPDLDLRPARIVWEARDQEPAYGPRFTFTAKTSGPQWVEAEAALPDGRRVSARAEFLADSPVVFWVNGSVPAGASLVAEHGDSWQWIKPAGKPPELAPFHDVPQHECALASGIHEHGFYDAQATLSLGTGDVLFAYAFLDPQHPPKTIMLEWNDGSNEHRAFWGENHIPYGKMNTDGQRPMGPLPPAGKWVRLEVPARAVGLEGRTVTGMMFRICDGRVRWDAAGKLTREALGR